MIDVTLAGTGGMLPKKDRWLTCCLISCQGHSILTDCGEGTQIALKCAGCRMTNIDTILITHFHADHISGLPGLLLSLGNEGRTAPVMIAGSKGIERIVRSICCIAPNLPFELRFTELKDGDELFSSPMRIKAFAARHTVPCLGYSYYLDRSGKFDTEKAKKNQVPVSLWSRLQKGEIIEEQGRIYTPDMVLGEKRQGIKLTYCTDSRPTDNIVRNAAGAQLLICEGLYYAEEKLERAVKTGHMLFREAAEMAVRAQVERLWLTHYSPAVDDPEEGLSAATEIFPAAECGFDGKKMQLLFPSGGEAPLS